MRVATWVVLGFLMSAPACNGQSAEKKPPAPDARTTPRQQIFVEVVDDRFEISRGLMCREGMAENWGMLFLMEREQMQRFWMKNTLIPLDMVFIDRNWRVVGVVENTEPLSLMSRYVNATSKYVLELNAGRARAVGLAVNTQLSFVSPESGGGHQKNPSCQHDLDCTGSWRPTDNGCGPIERCFGGVCITPPAMSGEKHAETGRLEFDSPLQ